MRYDIKPRSWQATVHEVDKISEYSSTPIDRAIREAIIGLRAFGLPTESSCIGHPGEWGAPYPWIQFLVPRKSRKHMATRRRALRYQEILQKLLDRFYQKHRPQYFEDRLSIHFFKNNKWGCFHLQSLGSQFLENCSPSVQARTAVHLQSEMKAFGKFLKRQNLAVHQ